MKKMYFILIVLFLVNGAMAQWYPLNSGTMYGLKDVVFTDDTTGYAVGGSGTVLKTTDAGTTWYVLASGTTYDLNAVNFPAFNTGYAVGYGYNGVFYNGIILKTIDGGITWDSTIITKIGDNVAAGDVFFPDTLTGYVSCSYGWGMYGGDFFEKTSDGGATWIRRWLWGSLSVVSIFFTDTTTGYAVGFSGHNVGVGLISKTTNGGLTWESLTHPSTYGLSSVYFSDDSTGYVVSWQGDIQKTTDGGITWEAQTSGTTGELESVFFPNASTGYIVGYDNTESTGTILRTNDGGTNWTKLSSGTANHLYSVHFTDEETGYAVGENGTILKTTNGGGPPVGIKEITNYELQITNYPNPFKEYVIFSYILKETTPVTLQIFNSLGQLVAEPFNAFQTKGEQKVIWNTGNLPAGIYFYRLTTDDCRLKTKGKLVKY